MRRDDGQARRSSLTRPPVVPARVLLLLLSLVVVGGGTLYWTTPSSLLLSNSILSTASAFAPRLPQQRLSFDYPKQRVVTLDDPHHNHHRSITVQLYGSSSSSNSNNKRPDGPRKSAEQKVEEEHDEEEENLNDVDARVLQSLLADRKLDLDTAEDIRKLLERGTVKRVVVVPPPADNATTTSEFSSQVLQKLSETKLFQKLRRNAFDFFESAGIAILNKIERDVKVVAALGVFAWDRAVRDVGRALPASSSASSAAPGTNNKNNPILPFLLSTSSAYNNTIPTRPQDELRIVRESVAAIVKQGTDPGRAIRTAAPTGRANAKARQTKAYAAQRQRRTAASDPTKLLPKVLLGGAVLETAYELQRELQVETSQPGYRTAPARAAIKAATKGLIDQARTAVALRAAERAKQQQQQLPLPIDYKFGVVAGTAAAAAGPAAPTKRAEDNTIDEASERRDSTERSVRTDEAYTYSFQDLQDYSGTTATPSTTTIPQQPDQQKAQKFQSDLWKKATMVDDATIDVAVPTDVEFVRSSTSTDVPFARTYEVDFANTRAVEIVTDDDDEFGDYSSFAAAEAKSAAAAVGDDALENDADQPPNPFTQLALRSFDIVFFLLEKVFLVAVPETLATLSRVASRIEAIQRKGRGKEGWKPLHNIAPTKGRY